MLEQMPLEPTGESIPVDCLVTLRPLYLDYDSNKWLWEQNCNRVGECQQKIKNTSIVELKNKYNEQLKEYEKMRDEFLNATILSLAKFIKASR